MVDGRCSNGRMNSVSAWSSQNEITTKERKESGIFQREMHLRKSKKPLISFPTPSTFMLLFIPRRLVYRYSEAESWKSFPHPGAGMKRWKSHNDFKWYCCKLHSAHPLLPTEWGPRRKDTWCSTRLRFCTISFKLYFMFHLYVSSSPEKSLSFYQLLKPGLSLI